MSELYYIQDSRSYVGNAMLWWAKNGNGYTTDLFKAETYTKEEAQKIHDNRETDIPWSKSYIDEKTQCTVDVQYVKRKDDQIGINLKKAKKMIPDMFRCSFCGSFMNRYQYYADCCPSVVNFK